MPLKCSRNWTQCFSQKNHPTCLWGGPLSHDDPIGWLTQAILRHLLSSQIGRFNSSLRKCSTSWGQLLFRKQGFLRKLEGTFCFQHTRSCICTLVTALSHNRPLNGIHSLNFSHVMLKYPSKSSYLPLERWASSEGDSSFLR